MKTNAPMQAERGPTASSFLHKTIKNSKSESFQKISEELFLRDVPIVLLEETKQNTTSYSFLINAFPEAFQSTFTSSQSNPLHALPEGQKVLVYSRSLPHPAELDFFSRRGFSADLYLYRLASWPRETNTYNSPSMLIDMAALFKAGYYVPRNDQYAKTLIKKPLSTSLPGLLSDALCFSVLKEEHWPITKALLDLEADPNRMSSDSSLPLNEALHAGNKKAAILLLQAGAKNQRDYNDDSAFDLFHENFDKEAAPDLHRLLKKISGSDTLSANG